MDTTKLGLMLQAMNFTGTYEILNRHLQSYHSICYDYDLMDTSYQLLNDVLNYHQFLEVVCMIMQKANGLQWVESTGEMRLC